MLGSFGWRIPSMFLVEGHCSYTDISARQARSYNTFRGVKLERAPLLQGVLGGVEGLQALFEPSLTNQHLEMHHPVVGGRHRHAAWCSAYVCPVLCPWPTDALCCQLVIHTLPPLGEESCSWYHRMCRWRMAVPDLPTITAHCSGLIGR